MKRGKKTTAVKENTKMKVKKENKKMGPSMTRRRLAFLKDSTLYLISPYLILVESRNPNLKEFQNI